MYGTFKFHAFGQTRGIQEMASYLFLESIFDHILIKTTGCTLTTGLVSTRASQRIWQGSSPTLQNSCALQHS